MKKALGIILVLALVFAMAVPVSAGAADDIKDFFYELGQTIGVQELRAAWEAVWADVAAALGIDPSPGAALPLPIAIFDALINILFYPFYWLYSLFA